jgi:hypothetical protein
MAFTTYGYDAKHATLFPIDIREQRGIQHAPIDHSWILGLVDQGMWSRDDGQLYGGQLEAPRYHIFSGALHSAMMIESRRSALDSLGLTLPRSRINIPFPDPNMHVRAFRLAPVEGELTPEDFSDGAILNQLLSGMRRLNLYFG